MKRILSLALTLAVVLGTLPARLVHADGQTLIQDQSFTTPTDISVSFAAVPLTYVAQTFTAGQSGILRAVTIDMVPASEGDIRVDIRAVANGVPTDKVLANHLLSLDELQELAANPLSYQITIPDTYITAGTQYAIVINYNSYTNHFIPQGMWFGAQGDHYTGGAAFTAAEAATLNWTPEPDGRDLHFRTFVITGVPVSDLQIERVSGAKKAHACEIIKETYRITNLGPDPATRVTVTIGGTDHFDFVSVDRMSGSSSDTFDMAVGESRLVVAYFQVTAYVPGESKTGWISGNIGSDPWPDLAYDPATDNNQAATQIRMVGKPVMSCWP
jgi:hypothetical protein